MTGSLQIKKNMYYAVINLRDENGNRKQKWISTGISALGNNKRQANAALRRILDRYESGKVVAQESILFSEAIKQWLESVKNEVDPVTWQGYASYVHKHLVPYFEAKKIKLDALTPQHIEEYYSAMLRNGRVDGKGGLSPHSIKKHAVVIQGTLKEALKRNAIPYNPADRAKLPKCESKPIGKFFNLEQVQRLLQLVKGKPIEPAVVLTVYYGFRRSEICGLKWDAIDFESNTLMVRNTIVKVASQIEKERTKTKSSYRTLPLLPNVREYLLELKARQEREKALQGRCYHQTDYVCRWPDGRPLGPDYISASFRRILKQSDLPVIRFHDLRHTTASLLLSLGYSIKDIGDWLGHSDYATTANIYAHLDIRRKIDMGDKLSKTISL
ncbi:MAG TPA: site-specific integrase [Clostridiales bacterium]|nr:site-specific integrase [Clostridiales bacterium]